MAGVCYFRICQKQSKLERGPGATANAKSQELET